MDHRQRKFFQMAIANLVDSGVSVHVSQENCVTTAEGVSCTGFFDGPRKRLEIACGDSEWFEFFVHEYSHFEQWKEDKEYVDDDEDLLDKWLVGKIELEPAVVEKLVRDYQRCELDCEKRTVKHMWTHKLQKNLEDYIQLANAYVLVYNLILKRREWIACPTEPEILKLVPRMWLGDAKTYFESPPGFEEAVIKSLEDDDQ